MSARDHGVKLPERWWEVWDVEREVLGFLVVVGRGGTYNAVSSVSGDVEDDEDSGGKGSGGKLWIVEEGEFKIVRNAKGKVEGQVVAIGSLSVETEMRRLLQEA